MAIYQEKDKKKWTKDGRKWYFMLYKDGTKYKSKKYFTKEEATKGQSIFILDNKNCSKHKFIDVANSYFNAISKSKKESTVFCYRKDYNKHIYPYFEKYDIENINMQLINNWFNEMENKKLSVSFMNKIYNVFKCILDHGIKNCLIKENLLSVHGRFQHKNDEILEDKDKIRYITYEEFSKFISVIDNPLWHAFFTFAYYTGCRKGEILALTWNDIDFNKKEIAISKTLYSKIKGKVNITSTKNNKNRKIKMSKVLIDELMIYKSKMEEYVDFNNKWYVFGNTQYLPPTTIDNYKHKYFKLSNVHEITMHEFRHSHVSLLINEYVKSNQTDTAKFFLMMSNRMGHTIEVMQNTYIHLFPTIQDEIVNILDNL